MCVWADLDGLIDVTLLLVDSVYSHRLQLALGLHTD